MTCELGVVDNSHCPYASQSFSFFELSAELSCKPTYSSTARVNYSPFSNCCPACSSGLTFTLALTIPILRLISDIVPQSCRTTPQSSASLTRTPGSILTRRRANSNMKTRTRGRSTSGQELFGSRS